MTKSFKDKQRKLSPSRLLGEGPLQVRALEAGFAVARCGVRQQNETSPDHGRAAARIHERTGLSKLYL